MGQLSPKDFSVDLLRILKRFTSSTNRSVHPSAFLGYRPLTVFIVSQVERLVNTFFEISQTFFKGRECRCSVHPHFQRLCVIFGLLFV